MVPRRTQRGEWWKSHSQWPHFQSEDNAPTGYIGETILLNKFVDVFFEWSCEMKNRMWKKCAVMASLNRSGYQVALVLVLYATFSSVIPDADAVNSINWMWVAAPFLWNFPPKGFFLRLWNISFAEDSKPGTVKPGTFPLANATGDLRSNPLAGRQSDRNCCPRNKLESARNILNLWWPFGKLLRVPVLRVRMCSPIVAGTVHPSN